ncbi:MAG: 2-hydroxyacyl-CoA dehydratase [Firmicutes bacterium]|jgi:benzoyl-CoA reductase/2-hydroxyglutaryl-CoA dehydratase subunit BcrC/BadD/HgdB|nr:2-hydroxyacyl-CoA dehydratase [Bacillota bacterium]
MSIFDKLRADGLQAMLDGRKEGLKVIGAYCTFFPQELAIAAGAVPVSLCGTKEDPIAAAEEHLPRNLCPLIKSSYGFAITDTCPYFVLSDLIVGETTCDGKKKMFELMQEKKPVHVMQLPPTQEGKETLELWAAEIRRLKERIEEEFQVTISNDDIREAIRLVNDERQAIKDLLDTNKENPPLIPNVELIKASWSSMFAVDKQDGIKAAQELIAQMRQEKADAAPTDRPRVLVTGCPIGLGSEKVVKIIEELGADMVAMENCTGYKTLELQADPDHEDPIMALAEKYIKIPCSCMSPNPGRLDLLRRMIADFKVDAVIDLTWQACHTYNIEAYSVGQMVKDLGLPYLQLETDYSNSDVETLKVRIEALLEMTR